MPLETPQRIVTELARRGYNADREAVTLLAGASDPERALAAALDTVPDHALKLSADHVRETLDRGAVPDPTAAPTDASPKPAASGDGDPPRFRCSARALGDDGRNRSCSGSGGVGGRRPLARPRHHHR
nr:hypothetical protein [Halomarina oriensis]